HRISNAALSLMLEAKLGERPPEPPPINQPEEDLNQFKGAYESQSYWAKLEVRDDGTLVGNISGQVTRFIAAAGRVACIPRQLRARLHPVHRHRTPRPSLRDD